MRSTTAPWHHTAWGCGCQCEAVSRADQRTAQEGVFPRGNSGPSQGGWTRGAEADEEVACSAWDGVGEQHQYRCTADRRTWEWRTRSAVVSHAPPGQQGVACRTPWADQMGQNFTLWSFTPAALSSPTPGGDGPPPPAQCLPVPHQPFCCGSHRPNTAMHPGGPALKLHQLPLAGPCQ